MNGKMGQVWRAMLFLGTIVLIPGCSHHSNVEDPVPGLAEEYFALSVAPEEWSEIIDGPGPDDSDLRNLRNCAHRAFVAPTRGPWENVENMELAEGREDVHRSYDRVIRVGEYSEVGARMAYKDSPLQDEWVRVFHLDCEGWKQVATMKTDEKGNVAFRLKDRLSAGVYGVAFQVVGDGSWTRAQVWVLPRETEVVTIDLFQELPFGRAEKTGNEVNQAKNEVIAASQAGKAVVYFDSRKESTRGSESLRREIIEAGLPMGPVIIAGLDERESLSVRRNRGTDEGSSD